MSFEDKSPGAFLTIGEISALLGIPQHILRFWETRFPQLRPLKRSGNRRYYRPEDVALVRSIDGLLNRQGYTVAGAQKRMRELTEDGRAAPSPVSARAEIDPPDPPTTSSFDRAALQAIRDMLADALERTRTV